MKTISQPICIRIVGFYEVQFYSRCSTTWASYFCGCYHDNILGSWPLWFKGFFGHHKHFILIFVNSASTAWSGKHRSSTWPCLIFFELKITKMLKSGWRVLEKSGLPLDHIIYSRGCVTCRTITLLCFNCFCCKLTKTMLFIYPNDSIYRFILLAPQGRAFIYVFEKQPNV